MRGAALNCRLAVNGIQNDSVVQGVRNLMNGHGGVLLVLSSAAGSWSPEGNKSFSSI